MAFVFATALVVLIALGVTLWTLFPLDRPQVFFLTSKVRSDMDVRLYSMPTKSTPANIELYKTSFIKEYIRARNEIVRDANTMHRKWANSQDGVVNMWSTPDIYNAFTRTAMWSAMMYSNANIDMTCQIEFPPRPISERTADKMTYTVEFSYICANSDGQTDRKDYKIIIGLEKEDEIKWGNRINNPLGILVNRYEIESGDGDPLNFE